jgi:hypothetical protein
LVYVLWKFDEKLQHDIIAGIFESLDDAESRRREINPLGGRTVIHDCILIPASNGDDDE